MPSGLRCFCPLSTLRRAGRRRLERGPQLARSCALSEAHSGQASYSSGQRAPSPDRLHQIHSRPSPAEIERLTRSGRNCRFLRQRRLRFFCCPQLSAPDCRRPLADLALQSLIPRAEKVNNGEQANPTGSRFLSGGRLAGQQHVTHCLIIIYEASVEGPRDNGPCNGRFLDSEVDDRNSHKPRST